MKPITQSLCFLLMVATLRGQTTAWKPSAGHTQVAIWPGAVPDAQPVTGQEVTTTEEVSQVAGQAVDVRGQGHATYHDALPAQGEQPWHRGSCVSRRRLSDSGHRS